MTVVDDVSDEEREIALEDAQKGLGSRRSWARSWVFRSSGTPRTRRRRPSRTRSSAISSTCIKQARTAFGRIAAQTAANCRCSSSGSAMKSASLIYNEFKDRKGELIKVVVRRFEKGNNIIVDLGRTEGILPVRERDSAFETYRPGDRIVAWMKDLDREARGPAGDPVRRSDPKLVEKLFESEVPEIYEGIVRIVACAREPGARSKIAVTSRDADVDPIGACVGMKSSRVQAVVQKLPWREDRHRPLRPRSGALRVRRHSAGRGQQGHRGRGRRAHGARGPGRRSSRSPSAAKGRPYASPPS